MGIVEKIKEIGKIGKSRWISCCRVRDGSYAEEQSHGIPSWSPESSSRKTSFGSKTLKQDVKPSCLIPVPVEVEVVKEKVSRSHELEMHALLSLASLRSESLLC